MGLEDLTLTIYGNPVLRQRAEEITEFTPDLKDLAQRMFEVMYEEEGVGLAANQIGVARRICVLDVPREEEEDNYVGVLINPRILSFEGTQKGQEGCLSVPGLREDVARHQRIQVEAQGLEGEEISFECTDLLSRAVQHEIDHLNGVLYIDRLSPIRRRLLAKKLKQIASDQEQAPV